MMGPLFGKSKWILMKPFKTTETKLTVYRHPVMNRKEFTSGM